MTEIRKGKKRHLLLLGVGLLILITLVICVQWWWDEKKQEPINLSFGDFVTEIKVNPPHTLEVGIQDLTASYDDGRFIMTGRDPAKPVLDALVVFGLTASDLEDTHLYYRVQAVENQPNYWNFAIAAFAVFAFFSIIGVITERNKKNAIEEEELIDTPKEAGLELQTSVKKSDVTWEQIAGARDAVTALKEATAVFLEPERAAHFGAVQRKGILLTGPPGTGKTLLAQAMANSAEADFKQISASSFVRLYAGSGAARVREFFKGMSDNFTIVFIDEIDAVGQKRIASEFNQEREQTLNELLNQMDGFEKKTNILILAATNLPETLDPALLRQGRFDRIIKVSLPSYADRFEIFKIHLANKPAVEHIEDSSIWGLAKITDGLSGADIKGIINEACTRAFYNQAETVTVKDLEAAGKTVSEMGYLRRS